MDFGGGDEIRFERRGLAGLVTLTRPDALNAVTHGMVMALTKALDAWEHDPTVALVIVQGEGRAFSAGGDIQHIYKQGRAGTPPVEFFADEYRLNARIARFPKPYIAIVDGIVMGGGVGISFHGSHRVLTENAVFAMPEVGIGFFPDVGASHLLPDLGGSFGLYLGLTGARIRNGDALWSGLATHTIQAGYIPGLVEDLCSSGEAEACLREVFQPAKRETTPQALAAISRHFSSPSLNELIRGLEREAGTDEFVAQTLEALRAKSPTSLSVAFRQIRAGQTLGMDECMRMEFRIVNRMLQGHDFFEGIRAAIIEKGSPPRWDPPTLAGVSEAAVKAYFAPLSGGDLVL
jgi:enoyl-CoA hydratase